MPKPMSFAALVLATAAVATGSLRDRVGWEMRLWAFPLYTIELARLPRRGLVFMFFLFVLRLLAGLATAT